jgi:uncharacterized membrane protein (UPF0136 family)
MLSTRTPCGALSGAHPKVRTFISLLSACISGVINARALPVRTLRRALGAHLVALVSACIFNVIGARALQVRTPVRTRIFMLPLDFDRAFAARIDRPPGRT